MPSRKSYYSHTAIAILNMKSQSFTGLSDDEKCELLSSVGRISCAVAGALSNRLSVGASKDMLLCHVCDHEDHRTDFGFSGQLHDFDHLWSAFSYMLPRLTRAPSVRITAMAALRRTLVHAPSSSQMQLASSDFGEFCLHSLRSSIRELRIVTGYEFCIVYTARMLTSRRHSMVAFVRKSLDPDIRRSNFVVILEWLKSLSEKKEMPLHETCILMLCRLARCVYRLPGKICVLISQPGSLAMTR